MTPWTDLIETSVDISRPIDGGIDVLRQFSASIGYSVESGPDEIGCVSGWIGWRIDDEDLLDAADAISSDAEQLGEATAAIIDAHPDAFIDNVLLIDHKHLAPQWRGNRLSGAIIADLLSLLRLDADSTVVVLQPEPQEPTGGPIDDGPARDKGACATHVCVPGKWPGAMAPVGRLVASVLTQTLRRRGI